MKGPAFGDEPRQLDALELPEHIEAAVVEFCIDYDVAPVTLVKLAVGYYLWQSGYLQ